jgi:hypothetical protein
LSGVPKFGYADSIFFIDVGKEFEILTSDFFNDVGGSNSVQPEIFNAALNIACEMRPGRGKAVRSAQYSFWAMMKKYCSCRGK